MSLSMIPFSIILATYVAVPAHIFERVHTVSLQIIWSSFPIRLEITSKIPSCITTSVYSSDPVTKFPQVLRAGITIGLLGWLQSSRTQGVTPVSIIIGIVSTPASEQYESAHRQSIIVSLTFVFYSTCEITGIIACISITFGSGLPLTKFAIHQTTFLTY